jgi:TRAP-type C4-dicarboxylate transport system permease small subunit
MNRFVKIVHKLAKHAEKLSWVALAGMMVIVVFNCISRRLGWPIYGTYDYACFLLVLVIVPALARCAAEKGHVFLPMLTDKFPQRVQNIVALLIDFLCFAFCGIMVWILVDRALRNMASGLTGMTTPIPVYPFIFVEAAGMLLLCLVYLTDMMQTVIKMQGGGVNEV